MSPMSPFDIPEIASLIASYISNSDLARCARVSRSLHDICIPFLWKSIHFHQLFYRRDRDFDEDGYRVDLIRYGKLSLIEELTLSSTVRDDDLEMIAEHCTGLKTLNFDGAHVTAKNLAVLFPSSRSLTEDADPDDESKRQKTRIPSNLESLRFKECYGLIGASCLEIVALLGPQLKRLHLYRFKDIKDQDLIKVVKRCPSLVELRLNYTLITDEFLKNMAQEFLQKSASTHGSHKCYLENLNLDWNERVSAEGILPAVTACKSTLKSLSAQRVGSVDDNVLFALVGNPIAITAAQGSKAAPHLTTQANALKQSSNKTPFMRHQFSPNTVLTEIRLSQSFRATDAGFQVLFRFATELASITLTSCHVEDGALMVLAETYRNRMKSLGLGVPAAWREHVLAEERVQAMSREGAPSEDQQSISPAAISAAKDSTTNRNTDAKTFTGMQVPGGLKSLSLVHSDCITNKGVRAILRSCVGLEFLDIGDCYKLTLGLFQGPWACSRLKHLNMSKMALEITPENPEDLDDEDLYDEDLDDDADFDRAKRAALYEEELAEYLRFPLAMAPYPQEDDIDETGNYDHMAILEDEDDSDGSEVRRNNPRQRAILRQFYSKLGELSQLQTLNMSYCAFRVRTKDGLKLVLRGLQQNLTLWDLNLDSGNMLGKSELRFFCRHFGYGHDLAIAKDDGQDRLEGKARKARLQTLILHAGGLRDVSFEELDWARRQGFRILLEYM
ncbi:hypothetical protein EC968_007704 [Mortierella alpina]|nr:hypothetical protein EC968_007704 [Mortierella alpina]